VRCATTTNCDTGRRILDLYAAAIGRAPDVPLGDREHTTFVINDYPT